MKSIKEKILSIPDFPSPGITFRDITTLLEDGEAFQRTIAEMSAQICSLGPIDKIVGIEARGFIFSAPLAASLGVGLVLARKPGKLPRETVSVSYQLEYGEDRLELCKDSIHPGERIVFIDDLLATGGTVCAVRQLVESLGGVVAGLGFVIELTDLHGRDRFADLPLFSLIQFDGA